MLYNRTTKETLAYVKKWTTHFLFHLLNLLAFVAHLMQIDNNIYK